MMFSRRLPWGFCGGALTTAAAWSSPLAHADSSAPPAPAPAARPRPSLLASLALPGTLAVTTKATSEEEELRKPN